MWPELLHDQQIAATWFSAFTDHSIIFRAFQYAAATHADALLGRMVWSNSREMLAHKLKTIHLLNQALARLDSVDFEIVIHVVLLLASNELAGGNELSSQQTVFSPHFPTAGWLSVFANIKGPDQHVQALRILVERAGGLTTIQFPGLGAIIAL